MSPYSFSTLSSDDSAGAGVLYPSAKFLSERDEISGAVRDAAGNPLGGVLVTATPDGSTTETVGALSRPDGTYRVQGLLKDQPYRIRARSGSHIPQFYSNVRRLEDATPVVAKTGVANFSLNPATVLARFDYLYEIYILRGSSGQPVPISTDDYYAVKFPPSVLPAAFKIIGMEFLNNDWNTIWPRIMLCDDDGGKPNLRNPLCTSYNYQGNNLDWSLVDNWPEIMLTNHHDIWVVFQCPAAPEVNVGVGPAIGGEMRAAYFESLYFSEDGGASFVKYPDERPFDALVRLMVQVTDEPVPVLHLAVDSIDFGAARINKTTLFKLPLSNPGTAELIISNPITSDSTTFSAWMNNYKLPVGSSDTILVSFLPASTSVPYKERLSLSSNDPARSSIKLIVTGRGAYPRAQLSGAACNFGMVEPGSSRSQTLWLKSAGKVPLLAWGFNLQGKPFSIALEDTLEISAGDSAALTINFSPTARSRASGALSFTVDDSTGTTFSVSLSGAGGDCDINGDGKRSLLDVLAFILLSRKDPDNPLLDWDGDGVFTLRDVLALARDIRSTD